jgi:hypothetical protein
MSKREMNGNKLKMFLSQLKTDGDQIQEFEDIIESMIQHHKAYYAAVGAGNDNETKEIELKLNQYRVAFY